MSYVAFDLTPFRKKKAPCDNATVATLQAATPQNVATVALSQTLTSNSEYAAGDQTVAGVADPDRDFEERAALRGNHEPDSVPIVTKVSKADRIENFGTIGTTGTGEPIAETEVATVLAKKLPTVAVSHAPIPDCGGRSAEDWQVFFGERAGIAEFDGELPRLDAETKAFECCVVEWQNRNPVCSPH
jgi:hypothetical protein